MNSLAAIHVAKKQLGLDDDDFRSVCIRVTGKRSTRAMSEPHGTMLPPSTATLGVARFISSLADIHVSPSPLPVYAKERKIRGISGQTSNALSAKSNQNGVSLKMSKDTCLWEPMLLSQTFKEWGLQLKQACFQRSKRERAKSAAASSYWPTPTKSLYCNRPELELSNQGLKFRDDPTQSGSQISLGKVARQWSLLIMLIKACGAKPEKDFSFQSIRPLHISLETGARSSIGTLSFNPNFSDWLMGWPIGWTDPMQPVTGWQVWLQRMRGELSKLPTI